MPADRLYLGTDDGLRVVDTERGTVTAAALRDTPIRDVAVEPTDTAWLACALGGSGLHRTVDAGESTTEVGLGDRWVWGVDRLPDGRLYAGTEPPGLFRRQGEEFVALDGIHDVAGREDWTFGYEPYEAGHVHGITAHPERPRRLFAAVEIGGVLVSHDGGERWESRLVGADVHRLVIASDDPDRVYAATESGLYESRDGGTTWTTVPPIDGLYVKHIAFGPDGTLYVPAVDGMGDTKVELFAHDDGWERRSTVTDASVLAFAVTDDRLLLQQSGDEGRLLASDDGGRSWTPIGPSLPRIRCIATDCG